MAITFLVVRTEGWANPWMISKILRLQVVDTVGLAWPTEVSQRSMARGEYPLASNWTVYCNRLVPRHHSCAPWPWLYG